MLFSPFDKRGDTVSVAPNPNTPWKPQRTEEVSQETLKNITSVIEKTPEMPISVQRIIEKTSNSETDLEELVELIQADPILVSNILKVVNSSYYGLNRKTDNLHLAVVLLGFKEVRSIAMKGFFTKSLGKGGVVGSYDIRGLWEHSYMVAVCAETFADEDDTQMRGLLLTLGLMHDIGKFALYNIAFQMKKKGIGPRGLSVNPQTQYLLEKEEHLFNINHPIMSGMLARKWKLSDRLVSVLECHHYPSFFDRSEFPPAYHDYEREITVACFSDMLARLYVEQTIVLPEPSDYFFQLLGLEPPLEKHLTFEMKEKLENARLFIQMLE